MRYDAFISYRHAELDTYVAKKVHKMLETFKVPRAIQKKSGKKKLHRVFRDQEELPIGSSLTNNIEAALQESEFLIVICSPRTPQSEWVAREIDTFIQMHDREHVLAILIEGEPDEAFPPKLLVDEEGNSVEPLAADVRGENYKEVNRKLKTEVVRLAAPLLHCSYDDLRQRHRERRMRKVAAILSGVAVLGVAFGVYSTINANLIRQNYRDKLVNQSKYLAETSAKVLETGDRKTAALIAMEALATETNDRPFVANAQYALTNTLNCYELGNRLTNYGVLDHETSVVDSFLSYDGKYVVSVDMENRVYLWDVESLTCLFQYRSELNDAGSFENILCVGKNDAGTFIAQNTAIYLLDDSGSELWHVDTPEMIACEISSDGTLAAALFSDKVQVIDAATGEIKKEYPLDTQGGYVAFSKFNLDYTKLAVAIDGDLEHAKVCVFDLADDKDYEMETAHSYISKIVFAGENQLAVISREDVFDFQKADDCECEKFDFQKGKRRWSQLVSGGMDKRTSFSLEYNMSADEIIFSDGHDILLIQAEDGALVTTIKLGTIISEIKTALENPIEFLVCENGQIKLLDLETGTVLEDNVLDKNITLKSMQSRGGYVLLQLKNNQNLAVFNYVVGSQIKEKIEGERKIGKVYTSPDELQYAVCGGVLESDSIDFYDEADQLVYQFESEESDSFRSMMQFIDNETFMIADESGVVTLIQPKQNSVKELKWEDLTYSAHMYITPDAAYLLMYSEEGYCLMDLREQKIKCSIMDSLELKHAVYDAENDRIYGFAEKEGLLSIDASTGKITPFELPEYRVTVSEHNKFLFQISPDATLLSMVCCDGYLRILDIEQKNTICEMPYDSSINCFLSFTPDGNRMICMGDDYYLKVLNLKEQNYDYISTQQFLTMDDVKWSKDGKSILMSNSRELVILDADSYAVIAEIEGAKLYLQKNNKIWSADENKLYEFPYMDVPMLVEEFKSQFGDAELTEYQRVKYNVN